MTPMLLDINAPEFVLLLILAVILFGPERLPDLARKAARVVRYIRTMAGSAQEQLSRELGPGFEDLDLRDLNPRTFVQKHLMDEVEPIIADVKQEINEVRDTAAETSSDIAAAIDGAKDVSPGGPQDSVDGKRARTPYDAEAT
jgi:sec-independent protein translocase protein TatB